MDLPDSVIVVVLVRLPIMDIARLKLVCKGWKSLLESSYIRDLYENINQRKFSSPWSILYRDLSSNTALEFFCEEWGFRESLGSCVSRFLDEIKAANKNTRVHILAITDGLILTELGPETFRVADPVLREWIKIPHPPPYSSRQDEFQGAAIVTNINNVGYKVVRYGVPVLGVRVMERDRLCFQIYSSDSKSWTYRHVPTQRPISSILPSNPINKNGYLHWLCRASQVIFAYDFYGPSELCVVIDLPQRSAKGTQKPLWHGDEATLTISCGSVMYMNTDTGKPTQQLKIWRLKKYTSGSSSKESWEFLWNLRPGLELCLGCVPVAMHPFDKEIVYLVTCQTNFFQTHARLVIGNLRTKKFQLQKDWKHKTMEFADYEPCFFHQFVLPQRLGSIPCPP